MRVSGARPGALVLADSSERGHQAAGPGRPARRQGTHRGLHRRHDAELAAGAESPRPGVAVPAVLGPDDPLAGQPHAGREGRGRHHGPDRQGVLRAGLADHRLRRRPQSRKGRGPTRPRSTAQVKTPGGTTDAVTLAPIAGSAGSYQGTFEPKRPGTYEISVEATLGSKVLRAEKTTAEVGRPNLEFDRLDLDDQTLARIAGATGGRYLHISTADPLIGELDRKERRRHVSLEQPLYFPGAFWAPVRRRPGGGVGAPQEVPASMSKDRGYRFLDPAALARVKNLSLVARGVVEGFITGLHSSPYKGFSVEFAEHRKYSPGDNTRHLDWRILGRTDRLYIKQYEEETNLRAQILLDTSGSMGYGEPRRDHQARVRLAT